LQDRRVQFEKEQKEKAERNKKEADAKRRGTGSLVGDALVPIDPSRPGQ